MCRSVPQMVVSVMRITASPTPARGRSTSSRRMSFTPWKTVARIVAMIYLSELSELSSPQCEVEGLYEEGIVGCSPDTSFTAVDSVLAANGRINVAVVPLLWADWTSNLPPNARIRSRIVNRPNFDEVSCQGSTVASQTKASTPSTRSR
jgi:hypothetical protein